MRRLAILLALSAAPAFAGGCPAPKELAKGMGLDQSCKLYRIVEEDKDRYVLTYKKDGSVKKREKVDCSKAVYDPDGSFNFWPKTASIRVWCSAYDNPEIARRLAQMMGEMRAAHKEGYITEEEYKAEKNGDRHDK